MREIKFRWWRKEANIMEWDYLKSSVYYQNPFGRSDLITMQFTGLHDKNGKEIYEGDIGLFDCMGGKIKTTIVWNGFAARYERDDIPYLAGGIDGQCEVIGNIYENPELLKGE